MTRGGWRAAIYGIAESDTTEQLTLLLLLIKMINKVKDSKQDTLILEFRVMYIGSDIFVLKFSNMKAAKFFCFYKEEELHLKTELGIEFACL